MKLTAEQVTPPANKNKVLAREQLILTHLPLVRYIVERMSLYLPPTLDKEDLIEAGIIGLIDAVDKYDATQKCSFATYAKFRIRGAILDELRGLDWMPKSLRQKARQLEEVYLKLEQKLGEPPSDEAVAALLGISEEEYHQLLNELKGVAMVYLEDFINLANGNTNTFLDLIADTNAESAVEAVFSKELVSILTQAINELPEREKLVISLYYYDELTIREIGEVLGLAKSTVSELHTKALFRLRAKLRHKLKER
ncbi:MAG: FliA/WhiG family RNA polymerase sigma factor [Candidatus Desulfofervidaceae bacterium]|nr:FliA/WhiG family RNA polymerase sigma factor [Candidatus Desulfofervidaceae bacterium]